MGTADGNQQHDLLKRNEFRYVKLGGSGYRISRKSFDEWLDKQS